MSSFLLVYWLLDGDLLAIIRFSGMVLLFLGIIVCGGLLVDYLISIKGDNRDK